MPAFALPIMEGRRVEGALEFFSRDIREPSADLLGMMTAVCGQIGLFIERKRASDDLDRFFRLSLDLFCVASFEGYFVRVNPAWQTVLGHSDEELRSTPFMEFVHPDDRAPSAEALVGAVDRGAAHRLRKPVSSEGRVVQVDPVVRRAVPQAGHRLRRRS